jgi:hypothetical protein
MHTICTEFLKEFKKLVKGAIGKHWICALGENLVHSSHPLQHVHNFGCMWNSLVAIFLRKWQPKTSHWQSIRLQMDFFLQLMVGNELFCSFYHDVEWSCGWHKNQRAEVIVIFWVQLWKAWVVKSVVKMFNGFFIVITIDVVVQDGRIVSTHVNNFLQNTFWCSLWRIEKCT